MPKYQACPKCAAQFDVSAFAPGQKFTCGACGAMVVAGAPAPAAGRIPGSVRAPATSAPAVAGKTPGTRGAAPGAAHGPQYRPLERHQTPGAAPPAKPSRREHRAREEEVGGRPGRGDRDRKKSNVPVIAAAAGLLVAAGVGAFLLLGKGDKDSSSRTDTAGGGGNVATPAAGPGTTTPVAAPESLASIEADYRARPEHTAKELAVFLKRYKALGTEPAKERAKAVAEEIVKYASPEQKAELKEAHETLGHVEFDKEIPESITYYNEPFIRAVQDAKTQRWFSDKEQYDLAMRAWRKTEAHAQRLETDRVYAALTQEKARISRDDDFKAYNYATHFASPYLIFYSSKDEMSEFDLMKLDKAERRKQQTELDQKRKEWTMILAEKGKIYSQLYQYFIKRYGEECDLKDLMSPYGGRPDYPPSKRSFADGVPLIIWIFSDREAFDYHHNKGQKDQSTGLENVAGYFSPQTGWVYLYDEANRQFEVDKNVHEGTHQLQYWFTRQKREWATEFRVPQSFFGEGFAEYIGAVQMDDQRSLEFIGVNRSRLKSLQNDLMKETSSTGGKVPYFPVEELVRFEGYHEAGAYAAEKLHIPPQNGIGVFYIQSWAFVYYLNEHKDGKYRKKFGQFLNDILNYDPNQERYGYESFKKEFALRTEADWKAFDKEFKDFYLNDLKKLKVSALGEAPPDRDHWPGFKDPEDLDATNPEAPAASGTPPKDDTK